MESTSTINRYIVFGYKEKGNGYTWSRKVIGTYATRQEAIEVMKALIQARGNRQDGYTYIYKCINP